MRTAFIISVCLAILCSAAVAENVALGKATSSNSVYSVYGPEHAVDGDFGMQWSSAGHASPSNPLWMRVDLGALYNLDRVLLYGPQSSYVGYTVEYNVLISKDDVNWTNLRRGVLIDSIDFNHTIYASGKSARYVKFEGVGGSHWTGLNELEVYPVSAGTASVPLVNPTATYSQPGLSVIDTTDGTTEGGAGWALYNSGSIAATAVFETAVDAGGSTGTELKFRLYSNYGYGHVLGRFRLSITTADRSRFADGLATGGSVGPDEIWTVLTLSEYLSANGQTLTVLSDGSILASGIRPDTDVYTITAQTGISGITGVRLELMKDPSLPDGGPGRGWNGNPVLTEITLDATPLGMRTVHATCRSLSEPVIAAASSSFRFTVMGQVTVLDADSLLISSGSDSVKVIASDHLSFSDGHYARATGTPVTIGGAPALVCSREEVLTIE